MREDVVCVDDIGLRESLGEVGGEIIANRCDVNSSGGVYRAGSRVDAKHANAAALIELQQVAVIRADFHNETLGWYGDAIDESFCRVHARPRDRCEIYVLAEHRILRDEVA